MDKVLVFDMDGTIADLYSVKNWLRLLRSENISPYIEARPLYDMDSLAKLVYQLKAQEWTIAIVTWGSKGASSAYNEQVEAAKLQWLEDNNFPYDFFFFQPYGVPKRKAVYGLGNRQVLIDDNAKVRNDWNGETIDATNNILDELYRLCNE